MSQLTLGGLVFGLLMFGAYICRALHLKKKPDLTEGGGVFISSIALASAVRLIGFALTGEFNKLVKLSHDDGWWAANSEDVAFIVLGGAALAFISCDAMVKSFKKLTET